MPVFALVDCNNFYASCEKLFDPRLKGKPVVVLSNNDGVVVARSSESRALGVPMGVPWHELKALAQREGIIAYSSNYTLYADMSNRVIKILAQYAPNLENYSIDESFLELSGFSGQSKEGLAAYGKRIRERIARDLGLPVCVGIGPTKTLAKLANHCAKKALAGQDGVCDLTVMPDKGLSELLGTIAVGEVWGVGRKITSRLQAMGIHTVQALREGNPQTLRSRFSVVLERTVQELRGVPCLELEEVAPANQQILSSRSFGRPVTTLPELGEAVSSYIAKAAQRLREQHSVAGAVQVYLQTNIFKPQEPQYQPAITAPLPEPTADTRELTRWALKALRQIYRPGFAYKKAGVMLFELQPQALKQDSLFANPESDARSEILMRTMDDINQKWGRGTLQLLAEGTGKRWKMRRGNLSPAYTTCWEELAKVVAGYEDGEYVLGQKHTLPE